MIKLKNRALGAIGKHANRAGARWKCTPSATYRWCLLHEKASHVIFRSLRSLTISLRNSSTCFDIDNPVRHQMAKCSQLLEKRL